MSDDQATLGRSSRISARAAALGGGWDLNLIAREEAFDQIDRLRSLRIARHAAFEAQVPVGVAGPVRRR